MNPARLARLHQQRNPNSSNNSRRAEQASGSSLQVVPLGAVNRNSNSNSSSLQVVPLGAGSNSLRSNRLNSHRAQHGAASLLNSPPNSSLCRVVAGNSSRRAAHQQAQRLGVSGKA